MGKPNPDPGEEFPHVNTQLFGTIAPASNADLYAEDMDAPYNAPPAGTAPTMGGFVKDYHVNFERLHKGTAPTPEEGDQIMGGFSPEMLPVLSTLAREFAVFDHWFAAVPSQTYCNRSFFTPPLPTATSRTRVAVAMKNGSTLRRRPRRSIVWKRPGAPGGSTSMTCS